MSMLDKLFKKQPQISANRFLNIKDIQGNFLYTLDNKVLAYLKIYPKNCKLMSKEEQKNHAQILTRNFASELKPFKLYFTSEIYLIIWGENTEYVEQDLLKRLNDLKMKFTNSGYRTEILEERLIIQLVNSYTNPDVAYMEDQEYMQGPLTVN